MVVRQVLAHELSEMDLSERDHAVEAFLLDRTVESFHGNGAVTYPASRNAPAMASSCCTIQPRNWLTMIRANG